jgi:hypothetical protein
MALIGVKGFGALPKYCGVLMLAFFMAGVLGGAGSTAQQQHCSCVYKEQLELHWWRLS